MRFHPILLATAALALLSCGSDKDSYVVIHSDVNCDVPRVFQLRVTIYNNGTADQKYIPETPSAELGFPSTISLVLSGSRSGAVDLVVEALATNRQIIGQGTVSGTLVSEGRIDLSVQLAASPVTTSPPVEPGSDGGVLADSGGSTKLDSLSVGGAAFLLVSAGGHHTCATRKDTSLWCWGSNTYFQLRLSGTSNRLIPTEVSATSWATVACGQTDACGIRTDGTMSCWGNNGSGELGAATAAAEPRTEVPGTWQSIAPGSYQSCGIMTDGTLWCWGDNTNGQLGTGNTVATSAPTQVTGTGWSQVTTSYYHTCATKQDGTLWCWGLNANLQLADSSGASRMLPVQITGSDWTQVVTGLYHTCAIKNDKSLWCWGGNTAGQLGNTSAPILAQGSQGGVGIPLQVTTDAWDSISAGQAHTCGIMADQSLWCWGDNTNGQLGNGSQISSSTPVAVVILDKTWGSVSAGANHTCALATDSTLWCWGDNSDGQLGTGSGGVQLLPTRVMQ